MTRSRPTILSLLILVRTIMATILLYVVEAFTYPGITQKYLGVPLHNLAIVSLIFVTAYRINYTFSYTSQLLPLFHLKDTALLFFEKNQRLIS